MGGDLTGADAGGSAPPFDDFQHLATGASFLRADLHIHSFGVSRDVSDTAMTVEGILATAKARDLDLIAITDHNAIDSVARFLELAPATGLNAFAGVEISTGEGHVLVYFSPDDLAAFERWFNRLDFQEDPNSGDRHLLMPIHDLLSQVKLAGGIAVPAHIGRPGTGFEGRVSTQLKQAILTNPNLLAVEIDGPGEADWYSDADTETGHELRRELFGKRKNALGDETGGRLAKLLFSDAHDLNRIGRDRDGKDRITRIKMSEPSFSAFKTALADPAARIKLEARVPAPYPRILGARFIGGFLDRQEIAFSPNLSCLIGGRGAGKSTALESVRATCLSTASEIDGKPNCPETVQLVYRDQFGAIHYLKRDSGKTTYELSEGDATETSIAIEGYGQDRVAEIIRGYPQEPRPLLAFLDQFVDLGEVRSEIDVIAGQLRANAIDIVPLLPAPEKKAQAEKALAETKLKLKAIEESNLKEALAWRRKLQRERQLRERIDDRLGEIAGTVAALNLAVDPDQLAADAEVDLASTPSASLLKGEGGDPGVIGILAALTTQLSAVKAEATKQVAAARGELDTRLAAWKHRDQAIEGRVQEILGDLRKQGIEPDLAQLNRLTQTETQQIKAIADAEKQIKELNEKKGDRRSLLRSYHDTQSRRYQLRVAAMQSLTTKLNEAFGEFKVNLGLREGGLVDAYATWIRERIGNRFFQNQRLAELCQAISPIDLAAALRSHNDKTLVALIDAGGTSFFEGEDQAAQFRSEVGDGEQLMELERLQRDDFPEITLTTIGQTPQVVRFDSLSFGQKASILLAALLFSSEQTPLIIDQPEDHLDSQFISRTVVSVLRRIKEARQVIIATHNANITVLGDAEQIVPMQGFEGKGLVRDVGSVDASETRARACEILEGGESAYKRRGEMYGFELVKPA